jgi:hypothetical protein
MELWLLAIAMLLVPLVASATTYYVDAKRGDDANDGTSPGRAWRTIDKANSVLSPGDMCAVRAGVYADQQIAPVRSGTAKARILYTGYKGETPEVTGGRYGSIVSLQDRSYITVRGFKIHSPAEHDWVVRITGENACYNTMQECDITDPEGYAPVVIAGKASNNTIIDCTVHDTGHGEEGSGDCIVLNEGAHDNLVTRNKCYNACHSQIMAINGSTRNRISDNELYSTRRDWAGAGVNLALDAGSNTIVGNRIHDLGYITDQKCAIQITSADNVIRNNLIWNVGAFGIALQSYRYGGRGQEAARNLVTNNTICNSGRQGLSLVSKGDCVSQYNRILSNIVVGSPENWYGAHAWIMVFDTYHLDQPAKPGERFGNVFKRNLFFHVEPGEKDMVLYNHRGTAVTWSTKQLESVYPKTYGRNTEAAPRFVDAARADFRLRADSPAVDAGMSTGQPFAGKALDIGALEFMPAGKH